jgi:hypothetical protein
LEKLQLMVKAQMVAALERTAMKDIDTENWADR